MLAQRVFKVVVRGITIGSQVLQYCNIDRNFFCHEIKNYTVEVFKSKLMSSSIELNRMMEVYHDQNKNEDSDNDDDDDNDNDIEHGDDGDSPLYSLMSV
jgi:hypothetical protein